MKKLTHNMFIEFCKSRGIEINKITKNFIYLADEGDQILPNCHPELLSTPIPITLKYRSENNGNTYNIKECIQNNEKVRCIILLRGITQLGLKDTRDVVYDNWDEWEKICKKYPTKSNMNLNVTSNSV